MKNSHFSAGFTLIELLIVVAIIAILAAIAVPNFLEAQTRSKISRCKSDMRAMATAFEAYRVDNTQYPSAGSVLFGTRLLTTPIAFMTSLPKDPFQASIPGFTYDYSPYYFCYATYPGNPNPDIGGWGGFCRDFAVNVLKYSEPEGTGTISADITARWQLRSLGPDFSGDWGRPYDATNGTKSRGDIVLFGPGNPGLGF